MTQRKWAVALSAALATALVFAATPASALVSVDPDQGPTAGGTAVTLSGGSAVFTSFALGQQSDLFLDTAGRVWSAGINTNGELGNGTMTSSRVVAPVSLPSDVTVTAVAAAKAAPGSGFALDSTGSVWAWGSDSSGQLGDGIAGSPRTTPAAVTGIPAMAAVSPGSAFALGLSLDGTVWSWGANSSGQLGRPLSAAPGSPQQVSGLPADITAVSAGSTFSVALASDGSVWTWGDNSVGQLGNGTTTGTSATPAQVGGLPPISAIAAGLTFVIALATDGRVFAWGNNATGQLGTGTAGGASGTPQQVALGAGAQAVRIAAGGAHALAVLTDGSSRAWGTNTSGQLGINSTTSQATPVAPNLPAGSVVSAVYGGSNTSLWVLSDNTVYVAGDNGAGQLGTGSATNIFFNPALAAATLTSVTFGGLAASNVVVAGSDITATTPAHPAGRVPVAINWAWGTTPVSDARQAAYTYGTAPTISGHAGDALAGSTVAYTYATTGDEAPTVTLDSGTLPPGLTISPSGQLTGTPTTAGTYSFTLAATNGLGTATLRDTVTISAATVATDPSDVTIAEGDTATFTATVTSDLPTSVRWQISTDGGSTWTDIPGATDESYTTAARAISDNHDQYRAVFTNSAGSVTTSAATLTVVAAPGSSPTPTPTAAPSTPAGSGEPGDPVGSNGSGGGTTTGTGMLAVTGTSASIVSLAAAALAVLTGAAVLMAESRRRKRREGL